MWEYREQILKSDLLIFGQGPHGGSRGWGVIFKTTPPSQHQHQPATHRTPWALRFFAFFLPKKFFKKMYLFLSKCLQFN
jgi:hypothetical protein